MIRKDFEICNKLGLHARAAAKLVQCATSFESQIDIERCAQSVNCKSIMGVMMLAASQGTTVTVEAKGNDEEEAIMAIGTLIGERFGEPE
ncbi:HPr family phosphocarrier protein [Thiorhodococcus mannitoliphagus]|uniref:HPr family phosphocarrier protein n=1 Tax=Thiorhodococcus mannitoliphagus TaxID=329406 RepID=A0A6P1DLN3_9GAMM|nr:HPr family phosphocarrier protein [Thiorhodococcus mannitoliphagus]NEX19157.1 HPr family phosphocarrier protein [Thiorhodococcus mannitoliphagus]